MVLLFVCMVGAGVIIEATSDSKDNPSAAVTEPTGTINLNAVFSPAMKRDFFNKHQQYQSKCNAYKEKIKDRKEGFKLETYKRYPIYDISMSNQYIHNIQQKPDGSYEMRVNISCIYDVSVRLNLFAYANETLIFDGGNVYFNMDIYQNEATGRYHLVSMDAYKHAAH